MNLTEYLLGDREVIPACLKRHKSGQRVSIGELLSSRVVYYPGSAVEESPIKLFCASHSAHVFLYVDYGFTKQKATEMLSRIPLDGYHEIHAQEVTSRELFARRYLSHLTEEELKLARDGYERLKDHIKDGFCLLRLYERNEGLTDEHGAERFALLYLCADAITTFDLLFGNTDRAPFACVTDRYGFGGEYNNFDDGSIISKVAQRTGSLPKYLLCQNICTPWLGYRPLKDLGMVKDRFLCVRED